MIKGSIAETYIYIRQAGDRFTEEIFLFFFSSKRLVKFGIKMKVFSLSRPQADE